MRWQWLLSLLIMGVILTACSGGQSEFDKVRDQVLDDVVSVDLLDHPVIVFALEEPLQPGDVIGAYQKEVFEPSPVPITIESETWFFWVDDAPGARFVHPNRFVFVEVASGEITVQEEQWWPVLNGEGLWLSDAEYWDEANWIYPEANPASARQENGGSKVDLSRIIHPQPQVRSPGAAIVLNGWKPGEKGEAEFAADVEQMVEILQGDGFKTSYFGPKNNKIREGKVSGEYNLNDVGDWFLAASEQLAPGDTLMVYISSHGWVTQAGMAYAGELYEEILEIYLQRFNPGVNVIVVIDACKSGAFTDTLSSVSDLTITSTNATDSAYGDLDNLNRDDIPDPNPEDRGGEFTSGFVEDWREIRGNSNQREAAQARALRLGTHSFVETASLSYISALQKDVNFLNGRTFPLAVRGSIGTRPTVLTDALGDGVVCSSGEPLQTETPPKVDIGSATVASNPDTVTLDVEIIMTGVQGIDGQLFGGIEFFDPTRPQSPPNSSWTYDGLGNLNFFIQLTPEGLQPGVHGYDSATGWADLPGYSFNVELVGNTIFASIPEALVPEGAPFYISMSDFQACDSVGVDADRQLSGGVPILLEDVTIASPDLLPNGSSHEKNGPSSEDSNPGEPQTLSFEGSLLLADDALGDVLTSPGEAPIDDPLVDIGRVLIQYDASDPSGALDIQIQFAEPGAANLAEYSFAVNLDLSLDGISQRSYLFQMHAGEEITGRVDPQTMLLIPSVSEINMVERLIDGVPTGALEIEIPRSELPTFNEIPIISFHMAEASSQRASDSLLIFITPTIINDSE